MTKMKLFTLPNFLTLGNLFSGCLAILYLTHQFEVTSEKMIQTVFLLMLVSLFCDFLDGMVARKMKINSALGVQLDSMADMVSFGVVPGIMAMKMFQATEMPFEVWAYFGLLITLFSALRLAKFNIDTEQSTYFKGLATPANTILLFSLYWIQIHSGEIFSQNIDLYFLTALTALSSYLLIANVPLFSFKFKGLGWKENDYKFIFILLCLILLVIFKMIAIPFILILYILLSLFYRKKIIHA